MSSPVYREHCPQEATHLRRKGKVQETEQAKQKAEAIEERAEERGDRDVNLGFHRRPWLDDR